MLFGIDEVPGSSSQPLPAPIIRACQDIGEPIKPRRLPEDSASATLLLLLERSFVNPQLPSKRSREQRSLLRVCRIGFESTFGSGTGSTCGYVVSVWPRPASIPAPFTAIRDESDEPAGELSNSER
jgi:hypothetical protein